MQARSTDDALAIILGETIGLIWIARIEFVLRDDTTYPAFRVFHVALVAGNDMDVQMGNRLSGPGSDVDADIVAVGVMLFVGHFLSFGDQSPQFFAFLIGDIEVIGKMPIRDDEKVPLVGRMSVSGGEAVFPLDHNATSRFGYAKSTLFAFGDHGLLNDNYLLRQN